MAVAKPSVRRSPPGLNQAMMQLSIDSSIPMNGGAALQPTQHYAPHHVPAHAPALPQVQYVAVSQAPPQPQTHSPPQTQAPPRTITYTSPGASVRLIPSAQPPAPYVYASPAPPVSTAPRSSLLHNPQPDNSKDTNLYISGQFFAALLCFAVYCVALHLCAIFLWLTLNLRSGLHVCPGIPLSYTKTELDALVTPFGSVVESRVMIGMFVSCLLLPVLDFSLIRRVLLPVLSVDLKTQESKGVGFTRMDSHEAAQAAINALNGKQLEGSTKKLNVKVSALLSARCSRCQALVTCLLCSLFANY